MCKFARIDARFYVGHNVQGVPTWTHEDVQDAFARAGVGGCTVMDARGVWNGECEDSSVVYVASIPWYKRAWLKRVCVQVRNDLKQECIMMEITRSRVRFV